MVPGIHCGFACERRLRVVGDGFPPGTEHGYWMAVGLGIDVFFYDELGAFVHFMMILQDCLPIRFHFQVCNLKIPIHEAQPRLTA